MKKYTIWTFNPLHWSFGYKRIGGLDKLYGHAWCFSVVEFQTWY